MRLQRRPLGWMALAVAAVVAVVAVATIGTGSGSDDGAGDPSSRNSGRDGTLALYEWLGDLGLAVHRVSGAFDLSATDVLFVVAPSDGFTDTEVARLGDFARGGGLAVVAVSPASLAEAQPLLDSVRLGVDHAARPGTASPTGLLGGAGGVHSVDFADTGVAVGNAGEPLLRTDAGDVVLSAFDLGTGRIDVLGSPYPLSNEGLRATRPDSSGTLQPTGSDAGALVLALLEHARPGGGPPLRIAFDEVHHGEGASGGIGSILVTPLGLALLLALVVVVAWVGTTGRRMGRPVPAGDPSAVPSARTFVAAMAQLYERSAQRGAVADRYATELKERVAAASGADPHLEDAVFVAAIRGHGEERAAEVGRTLARARALAAGAPSDRDLLVLARDIDAVEDRWTAGAPV